MKTWNGGREPRAKAPFPQAFPFRGFLVLTAIALTGVLASCAGREDLSDLQVDLVDQNGQPFRFPEDVGDRAVLIGYVYTHCPDICPMVTYNMRDVRSAVESPDLLLLSVSFDPRRDSPDVLRRYAESYKLDTSHWKLLTGEPEQVDRFMDRLGIAVQKLPSRFSEDGSEIYFVNHSDKVTLLAPGPERAAEFVGSELRQEEVLEEIGSILSELP